MDKKDKTNEDISLFDVDLDLFLKLDDGFEELENEKPEKNKDFTPEVALEPMERTMILEWTEAIMSSIFLVVFVFLFIARPVGVDGDSMLPTLTHGDNLILTNFFYSPDYGDIVVLAPDSYQDGEKAIVKRVIATEGQEININFATGDVLVDGVIIDEPYINDRTYLYEGVDFPQIVPENCIFVLGDNRNKSTDSRDPSIAMVPVDCILGRVVFRISPTSNIGFLK